MTIAALISWISTALAGIYLLAIWLIEYDSEFQGAAPTRLPVPVLSGHALLAVAGLVLWVAFLFVGQQQLAWAAVVVLGTVAVLGLTMAVRWILVYRAAAAARRTAAITALRRNETFRCRSSSVTASSPSPLWFWSCSLHLAQAEGDRHRRRSVRLRLMAGPSGGAAAPAGRGPARPAEAIAATAA